MQLSVPQTYFIHMKYVGSVSAQKQSFLGHFQQHTGLIIDRNNKFISALYEVLHKCLVYILRGGHALCMDHGPKSQLDRNHVISYITNSN